MNDYNDLQRRHGLIVAKAFNKYLWLSIQNKFYLGHKNQFKRHK